MVVTKTPVLNRHQGKKYSFMGNKITDENDNLISICKN
jgi:hypothetical protein